MGELREVMEFMKKEFKDINGAILNLEKLHTINNPLMTNLETLHDDIIPTEGDHQTDILSMIPTNSVVNPATRTVVPTAKVSVSKKLNSVVSISQTVSSTSPLNNNY